MEKQAGIKSTAKRLGKSYIDALSGKKVIELSNILTEHPELSRDTHSAMRWNELSKDLGKRLIKKHTSNINEYNDAINKIKQAPRNPRNKAFNEYVDKYMDHLNSKIDASKQGLDDVNKTLSRLDTMNGHLKDRQSALDLERDMALKQLPKEKRKHVAAVGVTSLGGTIAVTQGLKKINEKLEAKQQKKEAFDLLDNMYMEKQAGVTGKIKKGASRYVDLLTGKTARQMQKTVKKAPSKMKEYENRANKLFKDYHQSKIDLDKEYSYFRNLPPWQVVAPENIKGMEDTINKYSKIRKGINDEIQEVSKKAHNLRKDYEHAQENVKKETKKHKIALGGTVGIGGVGLGGYAMKKHYNKEAFDLLDNMFMEKLSSLDNFSGDKPSIDYKNLEVDPETGKVKLPWNESQVVSRIKVNNPATGKPIVMTTYKDAYEILDDMYMKKTAGVLTGVANTPRLYYQKNR